MLKTAILIDGGFFLKRYKSLNKHKSTFDEYDAQQTAKDLFTYSLEHLNPPKKKKEANNLEQSLYRIFYYDCFPFDKKVHNPITNKALDFAKTKEAEFRKNFYNELKKKRKVAIRLGVLKDHNKWRISPQKTKDLLKKKITIDELSESDVYYDLIQKGVDMKIGLDIASLAYKRLVDRIILFAGDSDFVPAAKVARREGIDFILDPMWNHIDENLFEHIDGLKSTIPKK